MHVEWGLLIVVYLFLGGLSAGAMVLSSVATLAGGGRYEGIARVGAWVAPWPVLVGTALLVFDLGQPFYFWKLFVAFEPRSPMWLGTWLLTFFSLVSVPYASTFLPSWLSFWSPAASACWRGRLAVAGAALGFAVGVYTGVLLGVLVARPLWNTPLVAQLFLVSALSTASALLILLLAHAGTADERRALARADVLLIILELLLLGGMFVGAGTSSASAGEAIGVLTHGAYGWAFWIGVVSLGLVVPLVLELAELWHIDERLAWTRLPALTRTAPLLVLAGGFLLRLVIVYAGQATALA
jgi:formate-dependent nitrite reductase membrane component NrfD